MSPIIGRPLPDIPFGPPVVRSRPARQGGGYLQARGLVARLTPIKGITPKSVLHHKLWLPVVLNTVTLTEAALHNDYDTLSSGQFSQPAMGGPTEQTQLRDIPLDTLTIAWHPRWLVVAGQNSLQVRRQLFGIMRSRKPVHLLLFFHPHPSPTPELDLRVTLRQGTRELRPAEHDTHYMTFQIKEWRDPTIGRLSTRPGSGTSRRHGAQLPTTTKLTATDTLDSLSKDFYGTYRHWRLIRDTNGVPKRWGQKTPLVRLPGRFKVGYKIKIPLLPSRTGGAGL